MTRWWCCCCPCWLCRDCEEDWLRDKGIAGAAKSLSIPILSCPVADLGRVADQVLTRSLRVQAIKGVPSIAEASALVAAGPNARLLGARVASNRVTCAIVVGEGS